jgi:hypothetical protein
MDRWFVRLLVAFAVSLLVIAAMCLLGTSDATTRSHTPLTADSGCVYPTVAAYGSAASGSATNTVSISVVAGDLIGIDVMNYQGGGYDSNYVSDGVNSYSMEGYLDSALTSNFFENASVYQTTASTSSTLSLTAGTHAGASWSALVVFVASGAATLTEGPLVHTTTSSLSQSVAGGTCSLLASTVDASNTANALSSDPTAPSPWAAESGAAFASVLYAIGFSNTAPTAGTDSVSLAVSTGTYSAATGALFAFAGNPPPDAPTTLEATAVRPYGDAFLSWVESDDSFSNVTIAEKTSPPPSTAPAHVYSCAVLSCSDSGGNGYVTLSISGYAPNTTYYFQVAAWGVGGESTWSNIASFSSLPILHNGTNGANGRNGTNGTDGAQGPQGPAGTWSQDNILLMILLVFVDVGVVLWAASFAHRVRRRKRYVNEGRPEAYP